ncbi:MAG: alpha/beta hydrolase [Lachnospiraceae bacterium]|nr:alpha/beta hydrolase [Lachnospiraceae bacterium]
MLKTWKVIFPAPNGPEERRAYLYLPESYGKDPSKRYPVLYMFDGHNIFLDEDATYGTSWKMKNYMDFTGTEIIVAGVECNHSADNGRLKEYSPFTFEDPKFGIIPGRARTTMNWMVNYFKKSIDRNYRTLPGRDHTFVGGSSMGGLISLYAVLAYNHVFCGAAALSPSLWTNPHKLEQLVSHASLAKNTRIYMDYGSNEMKFHPNMDQYFQKITSLLQQKNVFLTSRIVPYGDHCEACWEKQIPFFMATLLYENYC